MSPARMPSTSWTVGSKSASSTAGPRPEMAALTSASVAPDSTFEPRWTAISGSKTARVQPAMETVAPVSSSPRSVRKPKSGALVPRRSIAARVLKPTFQPRCRAPDDSTSRRIFNCAAMPSVTRWSAMAVQLVPGCVQGAGAAPAPEQEHLVVGRVVETVDESRRSEDDVVCARRLLAIVGVDRAASTDDEEELVAVGVAVRLVARAGRQHRAAQQLSLIHISEPTRLGMIS